MKVFNFSNFIYEDKNYHLTTKEEALDIINKKCKEKKLIFKGFVGEYSGNSTKLILYCPKHNHEWSTTILKTFKINKSGCYFCGIESGSNKKLIPESDVINNINSICNKKNYQFRGFVGKYSGKSTKLILYCPNHKPSGYTWSTTNYDSFKTGRGCPKCGVEIPKNSRRFSEEQATINIINKCKERGYEFVRFLDKYINNQSIIILNCVKHGEWNMVYSSFIRGNGCPICNESKGEQEVAKILKKYEIKYFRQHMFDECRNLKKLPFDFYLPEYNICIEYDGRQHYEIVFNEDSFIKIKENDKIKNDYCSEFNDRPKLIRIPYFYFKNIEEILVDKLKLF